MHTLRSNHMVELDQMIPCKHRGSPAPATSLLIGTPAFAYAQSTISP